MAKDLRISFLLDFYGDMLTETQREVVDAYYNEDLSLAEIAQDREITRQGVWTPLSAPSSSFWRWKSVWAWPGAFKISRKP